jgi:hypothetical protein
MSENWIKWKFRKNGVCCVCHKPLEGMKNSVADVRKETPIAVTSSSPGSSAERMVEKQRAMQLKTINEYYGRFKIVEKVALFLRADTQQTKNWEKGARGERKIGQILEDLAAERGFIILHDLRRPGTTANIDHIAITPSGIYVVDAKNFTGSIDVRGPGLFSNQEPKLLIDGRNQSKLAFGVKKQVSAVQAVLKKEKLEFPVYGVLSFWVGPLQTFIVPESFSEIYLTSHRGIGKLLSNPGTNSQKEMLAAAEVIRTGFQPA